MINTPRPQSKGLKKYQVQEMVLFAIKHLPQLDKQTLEQFAELVESEDSNYEYITAKELASKMQLMLRHIPDACPHSLRTLASLLDVQLQNPRAASKLLQIGVFAAGSMSPKPHARL